MWKPTISSDELYHHGILGQQWGHRNGPPYPLSASDHSISEKKAGYQKSINATSNEISSTNKDIGNTERRAKIVMNLLLSPIFPMRAVSAILDIGEEIRELANNNVRKKADTDRMTAPTDKKTGLKLQEPPKTDKENLKRVNINYYSDPVGCRQNCTNCTMAMELRLRGYEVEAQPKATGRDGKEFAKQLFPKSKNKECLMFPDPEKHRDEFKEYMRKQEPKATLGLNREVANKTMSALKSEPPNSRGQLLVMWGMSGGHSVMYRVDANNKVSIWDAQIGKVYSESEAKRLLMHTVAAQYQRLDNVDFNKKKIKEAIQ